MGWTDTRLDFEEDPDGAPKIERMDSMEMVWDCNAVKPNLADAGHLFRVREVSWDEAEQLTGESDHYKLHAGWVSSADDNPGQHDQERANQYAGGQEGFVGGQKPKRCTLVEARWFDKEVYYRGPDLQDISKVREYTRTEYNDISKAVMEATGSDFPAVRQTRKVVKRAFIGSEVLGAPDRPMVPPGLFGWECITGYRDENKRLWYGIVRVAKDPARWSNKFFSQVMFLLNSQSKGGIMAETGAFKDQRQAETSWTKTDAITWLENGAISGQNPKIKEKPQANFPAGFFALFNEAKEAISQVTGLSQEFIGTREVDQANVLEVTRRQSSLNLLAELFNSLRRYRKRQGKVMLYLIQEHLADGRLVRIVGEGMKQYVPLMKADVANREYDIIVDDSPTSPNERERTWAIIMQMLPMVKEMLPPEMIMEILPYSPLPPSFVEAMKRKVTEAQQRAAQQPKQPSPEEIEAQAKMQDHQLDVAGRQVDLQAKQESAAIDAQSKGLDLMIKQRQAEMDMVVDMQKAEAELRNLAIKERANQIAAQRANNQRTSAAKG